MELKVGDKVDLKSGGPTMTVTEISERGSVRCTWFWDGEYKATVFPKDALKKVS